MVFVLEQKIDSGMKVGNDSSLQITQRFITNGEDGFDFNEILAIDIRPESR